MLSLGFRKEGWNGRPSSSCFQHGEILQAECQTLIGLDRQRSGDCSNVVDRPIEGKGERAPTITTVSTPIDRDAIRHMIGVATYRVR
jgi:hypothetical protein